MKDPNRDKVDDLLTELECLKDKLDSNDSEQSELRSMARGLHEAIEKVKKELNDLEVDY